MKLEGSLGSLRDQQAWHAREGSIPTKVKDEDTMDIPFLQHALQKLGTAQQAHPPRSAAQTASRSVPMPFRKYLAAVAATFAVLSPFTAVAQSFPDRPVRIVVPFPAGGGLDAHARLLSQKLAESFQHGVIVDNRAGAGGVIGTDHVAKAKPDGYTLLLTSNGHAILRALYQKLPFDPVTDFAPVTQSVDSTLVLVANPQVPVKNVQEFVALAKSKPGQLNYGSSGIADPLALTMELLKITAGIDVVHIPYRGQAQSANGIMAGEVQAGVLSLSTNLANVQAGKIRALAVTGSRRSAAASDIPTVAESGLPEFESSSWLGLFAPAGTPRDVLLRIQREVAKVLALPDVRERLRATGLEAVGSTPEEFEAKMKADVAKFSMIAKQAKIPFQD
jgi:tripartite-type tricarboxylate transporter receptor subunit TctC